MFDGSVAQGLGIMAHQPSAADLDGIAALGVSLVRTDLSWGRTERTAGVYEFGPYFEMARAMRARGLRPIFILAFGNPLYSPIIELTHRGVAQKRAAAPATPEAIAAYTAWALAAVRALAEFNPVWEIWNEPDHPRFWPPEVDPQAYVRLLASVCPAIRAAASKPTIIGPAAAKFIASDFLGQVVASRAAACLDAVSVHPYRITAVGKEDVEKWGGLRRQIDAAQPGRALPIANSEWGRSNINGVTDEQQAAYLARSLMVNQAAGIGFNIWYVWKDRGDDPDDPEHHFGIQRYDGTFRLAQAAAKTLTGQIGSARFHCIAYDGGLTRILFVEPGGAATLAVWSQDLSQIWSPPADLGVREAVSMTGETLDSARITLPSRTPVYLKLDPIDRASGSLRTCPK